MVILWIKWAYKQIQNTYLNKILDVSKVCIDEKISKTES